MDLDWQSLASAASGGALVAAIAKWGVGRALGQLDKLVDALHAIEKRLAVMDVHVGDFQRMRDQVFANTKALAALEVRIERHEERCPTRDAS